MAPRSISIVVKGLRLEGAAGKKLRRKATPAYEVAAAAPPPPLQPPTFVEDEDIFGDVGREYICAAPRREGSAAAPRPFRFDPAPPPQPPSAARASALMPPPPPRPPPPPQPVAKAARAPAPRVEYDEYDFYGAAGQAGSDEEEEKPGAKRGKGAAEKPNKPGIQSQVAEIQRVITEKHGDKHAVAFEKKAGKASTPAVPEEAPAAKRKRLLV